MKTPKELDRIADVVLRYRPKPKTGPAKKRARKRKIIQRVESSLIKIGIAALFIIGSLASCKDLDRHSKAPDERQEPAAENAAHKLPNILPYLITDSGVVLYWESDIDAERANPDRYKIEQWWVEIQQCLQLEADDPPVIRVVNDIYDYCDFKPGAAAGYCGGIIYMPAAAVNLRRIVKHEFIHYLMDKNDRPEHVNHEPEYLWQCQYN